MGDQSCRKAPAYTGKHTCGWAISAVGYLPPKQENRHTGELQWSTHAMSIIKIMIPVLERTKAFLLETEWTL
jgi:hypothetical protein